MSNNRRVAVVLALIMIVSVTFTGCRSGIFERMAVLFSTTQASDETLKNPDSTTVPSTAQEDMRVENSEPYATTTGRQYAETDEPTTRIIPDSDDKTTKHKGELGTKREGKNEWGYSVKN